MTCETVRAGARADDEGDASGGRFQRLQHHHPLVHWRRKAVAVEPDPHRPIPAESSSGPGRGSLRSQAVLYRSGSPRTWPISWAMLPTVSA